MEPDAIIWALARLMGPDRRSSAKMPTMAGQIGRCDRRNFLIESCVDRRSHSSLFCVDKLKFRMNDKFL